MTESTTHEVYKIRVKENEAYLHEARENMINFHKGIYDSPAAQEANDNTDFSRLLINE